YPLAFHRDVPEDLNPAFDRLDDIHTESRTQPGVDSYRRGEPQPVETGVHAHLRSAEGDRLVQKSGQQRHGEETMRNRPAERRFLSRAVRVDVDPLMIAGG